MKKKYLVLGLAMVVLMGLAMNWYLSFTPEKQSGTIRVNMTIEFGMSNASSKMMTVNNGTVVFDVLNSTNSVGYKEYAGLGMFITGINGVNQNSTHYWFFYVNGDLAKVSSDKRALHDDSDVLFKFTSEMIK